MRNDRFSSLRELGMLSSLGIMFSLSIFIGLASGYYLDKWLNTSPLLTFIFLIFGIISAFLNLYREIKKLNEKDEKTKEDG